MSSYEQTADSGFDFESALITNILDNKTIRTVVKNKVNAEFFYGTQTKAAYLFLLQWFNNPNYGDTPSWESFQHSFPDFPITRVDDSTIALCDKVREQKLYSDIASVMGEVAEMAAGDPKEAFSMLRKKVSSLHTAHTIDESCDIRSRVEELREEYFQMKSGATGLKGHPWPWQALNDSTLGLQDQHLVFLYGRPKSGKTWLALEAMRHLQNLGLRVLILSQEMSDIEICRRFVALDTGVDYNLYLRGQLSPEVERDFLDNLDAFVEKESVIVDMLTCTGDEAVTELATKIDEYKVDVVLVDAVYTLGQDWKELVAVMAGFKRLAKLKRIPIVGTTQAHRQGKGKKAADDAADDFAYADAFYQWCTGVHTLVLDGNLDWVPVSSLKVGSSIVGFEEEAMGEMRRFSPAVVTHHEIKQLAAYRLVMESGTELITTADHQSLIKTHKGVVWETTSNIASKVKAGKDVYLARYMKPWQHRRDYETGFIAAAFDGEGFLRAPLQCVGMAQRPNAFLDEVATSLMSKGFDYSIYNHCAADRTSSFGKGDVKNLHIRGGASELFRFMGEIKPPRLLAQFQERFPEHGAGVRAKWKDRVVSVEFIGTQSIAVMSTSSKTFVAEGYGAHNCDVAIRITSDIEHKRKREAVLSTAALREGIPVTFTVNMRMATDLTQKAVVKVGGDEDIDEQIDQDTLDGQSDNPEEVEAAPPPVVAPVRKLVLKKLNGANGVQHER